MTVCLAMMVKNEERVLARALASVLPFIDCYAIVDTGSTDATEKVARCVLDGIPGSYVHREWIDYGTNRSMTLRVAEEVAGPDAYGMIVDADDVWSGTRPKLGEHDAYAIWYKHMNGSRWSSARYLRLGLFGYTFVVHENPVRLDGGFWRAEQLEDITATSPNDGASWSNPNKYLEHAAMIHRAMATDPANTRYMFYLARSYADHGDYEKAIPLFLARAAMGPGNCPEEIYCSYLTAGRLMMHLGRIEDAKVTLMKAHQTYPGRREAMAELARVFALKAATSPTVGTLFVEDP